jgi:hypothetical protein
MNLERLQEFAPNGGNRPRRIINDSDFELIIYDFATDITFPILYSYRQDAEVIDSLRMRIGFCTGAPWLESSYQSEVNKNLSIKMNDTIQKLDAMLLATEYHKLKKDGTLSFYEKRENLLSNKTLIFA